MNDKITSKHLERAAYVYIRQSTLQQVRHNLESNRRQYELEARARELGFSNVVVIDDDLGISGTGNKERPGFSRLLTAVCNGEVGGVFALEASRLARNSRDWHHLIDLCVFTDTVVVDAEGIYDPRLLNDRLLLGLKGTMSEFELGILRQRAQECYRQKVFRGEVLTMVPTGYVRGGPKGIEMSPDRAVQDAIRGVFAQFDRLGTVRQVAVWYHREKITFPVQHTRNGLQTTLWRLPRYDHIKSILINPAYAGAFAWGRTTSQTHVVDGRSRKSAGHRVAMDRWQVLLKDHHAAYISWAQYVENQRILASNRTKAQAAGSGAARKGAALLAGLLRCGHCGHKLNVSYRSRDGKNSPRYYCLGAKTPGAKTCLQFGGVKADHAVVEDVLVACQPMGIEASLRLLDQGCSEQKQKRRALELALERARYDANLAQRQYNSVDPLNRLVAAELEARWNAALTQLSEAEARLQAEQVFSAPLDEQQRHRLLELGSDLTKLWNDLATPAELKKRVLRTVIHEIVVSDDKPNRQVELRIHWTGGVHTVIRVHKNQTGQTNRVTDQQVIDLVREMAKVRSDSDIAVALNRLGYLTGPGNTWTEIRVRHLRNYHQIPVFVKSDHRAWLSATEAAHELTVGLGVIHTMIRNRTLPARQIVKGAPWMIRSEDLRRTEVLQYAKNARAGRTAPREVTGQTLISYT